MLDAIILAGGLGTRLAQTVPHLPKALAPIQDTPFLELLLQQLEQSGLISRLIFALGHKATDIASYATQRTFPFPIALSIEETPLGTGGALLHALPQVQSETCLILNGDTFFDLSLAEFLRFHRRQNASFSLACREVENASRYGKIEIDPAQRILSFSEKSDSAKPGWINAGIYLAQKKTLLPFPQRACSLEKEIFPALLKEGLFAYPHSGTFIDIGTRMSYYEAQELLQPWISSCKKKSSSQAELATSDPSSPPSS